MTWTLSFKIKWSPSFVLKFEKEPEEEPWERREHKYNLKRILAEDEEVEEDEAEEEEE